jgi:hypothetical protein
VTAIYTFPRIDQGKVAKGGLRGPQDAAAEFGYLQALMRTRPLSASFALQRCVGDSVMMISSVGLTRPSCR